MKRAISVVSMLGLLGLLVPGEARADRLSSARAQGLSEVSHSVQVRIDQGVARYRVRRTFANPGTRADEASLRLDLAHAAAVTGLRIRARDRWYDGVLMEAEEARAKYRELTGVGAWEPKDPALLQWVWADEAHLQVFPVLPGAVNTVEYTLTAPLEYRDGRYVLSYPRFSGSGGPDSLALAVPVLQVEPGYGDARTTLVVDGQRVAPGSPVVLGEPAEPEWVGDGGPDPGVGYAFSPLAIDRADEVTAARVSLEIDHTYRGDLRVALVLPTGEHRAVCVGAGSDNDLRGTFDVTLPGPMPARGTWTLAVADAAGLDVGTLDAWSLTLETASGPDITAAATGLPRFIPDAPDGDGTGGHAIIELEPPPIATLDARLGRVVASDEHGFSRLEIDAAPRLRPLPRGAAVVFVLDGSRSAEDHLGEQLAVIEGYLAHVPDARAEVVVFDRRARRLLGALRSATEVPEALARARAEGRLDPANGSALEEGLRLAAEVLHAHGGSARTPTRIVAMTDAALRTRFTHALAHGALARSPRATVTHLVLPEPGPAPALMRDDDHDLAEIAAKHHGVLFHAELPDDAKARDTRAALLGLVRPVSIDRFAVHGLDLSGAAEVPEVLREGAGYRAMVDTATPPRRVRITGKIWAEDFERVVHTRRAFDEATAAFVFSEDEHHDLSQEEMLTVAFKGRAVSPVTSYLATEPGVRPSTEGLDEGTIGLGSTSTMGFGGGGGIGLASPPPDLTDLLAPAAQRCVERLAPASGWRVTLEVETTGAEIVDVEPTHGSDAALRDCIVEEVWATALPAGGWPERRTHTIELS